MARILDGVECEFATEVKELAFAINEQTARRGCPGCPEIFTKPLKILTAVAPSE